MNKTCKCPCCNRMFINLQDVRQHVKRKHTEINDNQYRSIQDPPSTDDDTPDGAYWAMVEESEFYA